MNRAGRDVVAVARVACVVGLAVLILSAAAIAAAPSAAPIDVLMGGDPRSDGAGPGIVGSPLLILIGVVVLGAGTALVTALLARLLRRD